MENFLLVLRLRLVAVSLLYFIYFSSFSLFLFNLVSDDSILNYHEFNLTLSLASLLIFLILWGVGVLKRAFYFFCLPLVVLAVPNAINDLLPSFWAGPLSERGVASVPLITHIDLFLLVGVFLFSNSEGDFRRDITKLSNTLIFAIFCIVLTSLFGWMISTSFIDGNSLLFFGNSFQLRYLLYVSLFMTFFTQKDLMHFCWGLCLAICFLLLEASIYSFVFRTEEFTSGNFGTNTFGALLGFLLIYISSVKGVTQRTKIILITLMCLAVIATGTRSSIVALVLSVGLSNLIIRYGVFRLGFVLSFLLLCVLLNFWNTLVQFFDPLILLLETDYAFLVSQDMVGGPLASVTTRLSLWVASVTMLYDFPFGLGLSQFNFLKADYGFSIPVFIDPHNDYLNFLVQYGIVGGSIFLFMLLIQPVIALKRERSNGPRNAVTQLIIFSSLTGLSNSNFNKHQFFFMFTFVVFVAIQQRSQAFNKKNY